MQKLTTEKFLKNFYDKFHDGLDLDLSEFEYETARTYSKTICKKHNIVIQNTANNLLQGIKRCKKCKSEAISSHREYNLDIFLTKAKAKHGNKYDYSNVEWIDSRTKVKIKCEKHGYFLQNPQSHWNGYGCPKCGYTSLRKNVKSFVKQAKNIHFDRYNYSLVDYQNNFTPVKIICKEHGVFEISPKDHVLYQRGCPSCFPGNQSWLEIAWLDELNIPRENRQKRISANGKSFLVDALVGNTVYEFWGDFWHGNPKMFNPEDKNAKCNKTFKELYEQTCRKKEAIKEAGYNLVEIWEHEYKNKDNL